MKISSINYANSKPKAKQQQNFTGSGVDFLVKFWQCVDNGGRALQFTVEDMTGTNIPRSIKGAMAGYKYTHKINIPALLQEGIREFLTGPTMCVSPVAILALATRMSGKTANTHIENIKNLSYLMNQQAGAKTKEELTAGFFETAAKDLLEKTLGEVDSQNLEKDDVEAVSNLLMQRYNETDKKKAKEITENAQDIFGSIIKKHKSDYNNVEFLNASYSISKDKTGTTKFKNYFEYITSYAEDFIKKFPNLKDVTEENIAKYKNNWIGKRAVLITCMIGLTGLLMSFIPKIYTLASGGINPNASRIYDEARKNKNNNKQTSQNVGEVKQ